MEGAEWVFVNGHYEPRLVEQTKQTILETPSKDLQRVCMEAFHAFLNNVK
jgi:hypothetical protein